jgi:predicted PurR-regulated permease PerM
MAEVEKKPSDSQVALKPEPAPVVTPIGGPAAAAMSAAVAAQTGQGAAAVAKQGAVIVMPGTGVKVVGHEPDPIGKKMEEQRREGASTPEGDAHRRLIARDTLVVATVAAGVILLILLCLFSFRILLAGFAGILFAVLLQSLSDWIMRVLPRVSRIPALVLAIILVLGFVLGLMSLTASRLAEQAQDLETRLPQSVGKISGWLATKSWGKPILGHSGQLGAMISDPSSLIAGASSVVSVVVTLVIIVFVGVFLAAEPHVYRRGVLSMIPTRHRFLAADILVDVDRVLRRWLIGQLIDMAFIGVCTFVGLYLLGVPLALLLALLAALFNFVPNFGMIFSLIPAALLALAVSPALMLWVVGLFVAVQTFEGQVLQPVVQGRAAAIPPAMLLVAQVLAAFLAGPLGVILATPLLAVILVLIRRLYVEKTLGGSAV